MDITHQTIRVDGRTLAAAAPTDTPQQSADAARALLKTMRAELVDGNGRVRPGYLRIRSGPGNGISRRRADGPGAQRPTPPDWSSPWSIRLMLASLLTRALAPA